MNHKRLIYTCLITFICGWASAIQVPAATFIVGDGGDLAATVAAAPSGSIIEIQSNQVFAGALSWANKYLTIKAGVGFQPTVQGKNGYGAIGGFSGGGSTGGEFEGLRISGSTDLERVVLGGVYSVKFVNNEFLIGLSIVGTGQDQFKGIFEGNRFHSSVSIGGTGNAKNDCEFRGNTFNSEIGLGGTASNRNQLLLEGNRIAGTLSVAGISLSENKLVAINNVFSYSSSNPFEVGIAVGGNGPYPDVEFVNNTVVGFAKGIVVEGNGKAKFDNMLLKNVDDVDFKNGLAFIRNSLISDGSLVGGGGNFTGEPLFGKNWQLLAESPGIDAGDNAAIQPYLVDIEGKKRIFDGNFDGVARVDVGAYEFVPEPRNASLLLIAVLSMGVNCRRYWGMAC